VGVYLITLSVDFSRGFFPIGETITDSRKSSALLEQSPLFDDIFNSVPKEIKIKSHCYDIASEYRKCQENCVKTFFSYITSLPSPSYDVFRKLCTLYITVEGLSFPFPSTLREYISELGFDYLGRDIFLQFLERKIIQATPKFVEKVIQKLSNDPKDNYFKYLLLSKLQEEESINLFENYTPNFSDKEDHEDFLLDYKLRKYNISNSIEAIDMENMVDSDFLPLSIFLESVRSVNYNPNEIKWLSDTMKLYNKNLKIDS